MNGMSSRHSAWSSQDVRPAKFTTDGARVRLEMIGAPGYLGPIGGSDGIESALCSSHLPSVQGVVCLRGGQLPAYLSLLWRSRRPVSQRRSVNRFTVSRGVPGSCFSKASGRLNRTRVARRRASAAASRGISASERCTLTLQAVCNGGKRIPAVEQDYPQCESVFQSLLCNPSQAGILTASSVCRFQRTRLGFSGREADSKNLPEDTARSRGRLHRASATGVARLRRGRSIQSGVGVADFFS